MSRNKKKIIRATTVPLSLKVFLNGCIEPLKEKYELVLVSSPGKEMEELRVETLEMREKTGVGFRTIEVPMERHISLTKDLKSLWQMIRVFHREKPYMVHSMTPKAGLICMIAAWICRVPRRVHTFTGLVWPTAVGTKRKILMLTDKILCACATHIIPEGEGVKNDLQNYITKKPMKVLGYGNVRGVDMAYWRKSAELRVWNLERLGGSVRILLNITLIKILSALSSGERMFAFIFVGRLVGDKGINELVEAFIRLREHYLNLDNGQKVRLVLVGPKEEKLDPVSELTKQIGCTPSIIEVGPVWGDDILAYYAASDCFVFPSYREGFPNTVLEAGAMGLPSIVTDINGSREIIVEGENGVIIPSKDADALYRAMLNMVEEHDARNKMASNARPMIESRFEQGFVRKCLFDFYDEIV